MIVYALVFKHRRRFLALLAVHSVFDGWHFNHFATTSETTLQKHHRCSCSRGQRERCHDGPETWTITALSRIEGFKGGVLNWGSSIMPIDASLSDRRCQGRKSSLKSSACKEELSWKNFPHQITLKNGQIWFLVEKICAMF